jgi:hypothetical protein
MRTSEVLANTASLSQSIRAKGEKATDAEKRIFVELDVLTAEAIKNRVSAISKQEGDIAKGSEEERFLEVAGERATDIMNANIKADLVNEIGNIRTASVGKAVFAEKLNVFKSVR